MNQSQLLIHSQISAKLDRLAQQLYEDFFEINKICLIGIDERGYLLAKELLDRLNKKFPTFQIQLFRLNLNKKELH